MRKELRNQKLIQNENRKRNIMQKEQKCGGIQLIENRTVKRRPPVSETIRKKKVQVSKERENQVEPLHPSIKSKYTYQTQETNSNQANNFQDEQSKHDKNDSPSDKNNLCERKSEDTTDQISQLSLSMMKMMKAQNAPKVEIDNFSGNPLEYVYFIENFIDMVESVVDDQRGRLNTPVEKQNS